LHIYKRVVSSISSIYIYNLIQIDIINDQHAEIRSTRF
jgi:hypothetical protein